MHGTAAGIYENRCWFHFREGAFIEHSFGFRCKIGVHRDHIALPQQFITVEDCEKVTRQLQFALEVDGVDYKRLEVSSPGIDRPLRHEQDYQRFEGEVIDITLKAPMGAAAAGQVSPLRKKFRGRLSRAEAGGWQIVWSDEPAAKPGQKISKKRAPAPLQVLGFTLDELREARLAPIVDFKGRGAASGL